jgi:Uncharacterized alpha/beta hydrolase domain (DUF2235)
VSILRDAVLRTAPQDEARGFQFHPVRSDWFHGIGRLGEVSPAKDQAGAADPIQRLSCRGLRRHRRKPIEVVAVWDTVGALGIPEYDVKMRRLDAFQFADLKLSPVVGHGRHAVAVNEMRVDFTPTLWDVDPRIAQMLFVGAHADVGGGYPESNDESALSDATLKWMTAELVQLGVRFSTSPAFIVKQNAEGPAHSPWARPPWDVLDRAPRVFPDGLKNTLVGTSNNDKFFVGSIAGASRR